MPSGKRERGFTYLTMLAAVAVAGIGLAATGELWSQSAQRDKEQDLLFAGGEYRRAIMLYYESTPGSAKTYPRRLEDLLRDERVPFTRRPLRKLYRDPVTGSRQWGIVESPEGGIMGVHSLSGASPIKTANFSAADKDFEGKSRYAEWKFVYAPDPPPAAKAAAK